MLIFLGLLEPVFGIMIMNRDSRQASLGLRKREVCMVMYPNSGNGIAHVISVWPVVGPAASGDWCAAHSALIDPVARHSSPHVTIAASGSARPSTGVTGVWAKKQLAA